MADMENPQMLICDHCEGRGYVGEAYWDDELEWYIYETTGASCEACEGSGEQSFVSAATEELSCQAMAAS
jgi:hypothetical protein